MIKSNKFIAFVLVLGWATTNAQESQSFSLEEAISYGLKHNYQVQQANLDVDISKSKVKETTAIGLPQVNAEASFNDFINIPVQVAPADAFGFPDWMVQTLAISAMQNGVDIPPTDPDAVSEFQFGQKYSASAGVTASQLLFDGSYFVGLKAAREYVAFSELGAERTESEVKTSISKTYINAIAAQENIKALEDNKANIEQIYEETSKFFEVGFLEKQDADQVKLLKSNITYQLDYANRQYESILNLLKFQIGMPVTESITLTDNIETLVEMGSEEALALMSEQFSAKNHVDFRTLEQSERLSELSLSNARAGYYPQLSAFISHTENAYRDEFDFLSGGSWFPTTVWGVQLKMPIFSSGMRFQKAKQAKLELAKTVSQKTMLEQSLNMQAINAASDYKSALERHAVVSDDLDLAKSIKETTRTKFNEGISTSNDLTQAESQYLTTLGNYINTTIELLNAKLNLMTAYGK